LKETGRGSKKQVALKSNPFIQTAHSIKPAAAKAKAEVHFLCGKSHLENWEVRDAIHHFGCVLDLIPSHEMVCFLV